MMLRLRGFSGIPLASPSVFSVCCWESVDVESQLYAFFYKHFSKGLVHLQILLSVGVLEPIPYVYQGTVHKCVASQKLHVDYWLRVVVPLTPALLKSQLQPREAERVGSVVRDSGDI